jgi:hypothetical protein
MDKAGNSHSSLSYKIGSAKLYRDGATDVAGAEFERFLGTVEPRLRGATAAYRLGRAPLPRALELGVGALVEGARWQPGGLPFRGQTAARRMRPAYSDRRHRVTTDERRTPTSICCATGRPG